MTLFMLRCMQYVRYNICVELLLYSDMLQIFNYLSDVFVASCNFYSTAVV